MTCQSVQKNCQEGITQSLGCFRYPSITWRWRNESTEIQGDCPNESTIQFWL